MSRQVDVIQFSDLSWVRTEGDDWLNVAMVGNGPTSPENADLIAAARNALPDLLAAARREARLREALEIIADESGKFDGDAIAIRRRDIARMALRAALADGAE